MSNQVWISEHLNELNDDISKMIFDDPSLVTDPTNLDELNDKLTNMIFKRHELPMNHYKVNIEQLSANGWRVNIGLKQI